MYYLEVQHLIHFDYHYLLVAILANFPNVQVTAIAACFMCLVNSFDFFRLKMGYQNATKNAIVSTYESFENLRFHQFPVLVISRNVVWRWIMSLHDKLGQARTCFCWITEKLQIVQLKISFHNDNFRMEFLKTGKFCHNNNNNIIKTLFKVASKSIHYNWTS